MTPLTCDGWVKQWDQCAYTVYQVPSIVWWRCVAGLYTVAKCLHFMQNIHTGDMVVTYLVNQMTAFERYMKLEVSFVGF